MRRTDKIIIFFYAFLAVSYFLGINYVGEQATEQVRTDRFVKTVDVSKKMIFDIMSDIESYPNIVPYHVLSARIIDQTENVIIVEEKVRFEKVTTKVIAKHTLEPYEKHILEILDGDAKGTIITTTFEEIGESTKITTDVDLKLFFRGYSYPEYFKNHIVRNIFDKVTNDFVSFAKNFDTPYQKQVYDIMKELTGKVAEKQEIDYWASLLEGGKMTPGEVREAISESEEAKLYLERKGKD